MFLFRHKVKFPKSENLGNKRTRFFFKPKTNSNAIHPIIIIKLSLNQDITFPVFLKIWPKIFPMGPKTFSTVFPAFCVVLPALFVPFLIANTMVVITPPIVMSNRAISMKFLLTKSLVFSNATFGLLFVSSCIASNVSV